MRIQLPLSNQLFYSDATRAFTDAIAGTHADYRTWISANHIGLRAAIDLFYNEDKINIRTISPDVYGVSFLECSRLARQVVLGNHKSLINLLYQALDNGFYIILDCDEKFIPKRWRTGLESFKHSELIHGYDDQEQVFYLYGFTSSGHFETVQVSNSDLINSIEQAPFYPNVRFCEDQNQLIFVRVNHSSHYHFDTARICKSIEQYLNSNNLLGELAFYFGTDNHSFNASWLDKYYRVYSKENIVYGMLCYDILEEWFQRHMDDGQFMDNPVNSLCALIEHKKCMGIRLDLLTAHALKNKGKLAICSNRYQSEICSMADQLLRLWLKYTHTKQPKDLTKISIGIRALKETEYSLLHDFLAFW